MYLTLKQLADKMALAERRANVRVAVEGVCKYSVQATKRRITRGVDPDGKPFIRSKYPGKAGQRGKLKGRGNLRRSVAYTMLSDTSGVVGSNRIYGRIHQFGGVIRPRNAKMLAIPLTAKARRLRPRQFGGLVCVGKYPRLWLVQKGVRETTAWRWHYILVLKVVMPQRRWLGVGREDEGQIKKIMINKTLKRVF